MAQITYADKTALYQNADVAAENKVRDIDMNEIKQVVNDNETKILLDVTDTAPAECSTGDMYFDTTDNLIYTATATDTWSSTGVAPTENTIYVVIDTQTSYIYNGITLVSVGGGASGGGGENIPIGTISAFAGNTAPTGYLMCDGSAVSRTTYSELFTAIGTTYGAGDGSTTFNLPNIKGRTIVMQDTNDTDFDTLGETGGEKTHQLTVQELASHSHLMGSQGGTQTSNYYMAVTQNGANSMATQTTGGNEPHNNLQPYIVLNYIIKATMTTGTTSEVVNEYSTSQENAYSCKFVNENFGELIWTNIGFTSMGTKNVAGDFSNYSSFKIAYFVDNNASQILTKTGNKGVNISLTYSTNYSRQIAISNSTITIGDGYYSGAINNNAIIPAFIIGYK